MAGDRDRGSFVARGGSQASVELSCDTDVDRSPSVIITPPRMLGRQERAACHSPVEVTSAVPLPAHPSPSPARLLEWSVGPGLRGSAETEPQGFERSVLRIRLTQS